jgi:diacylglycerol kinase
MMAKKNKEYIPKNHFESQKVALTGLKLILRNERNFRIQLVVSALVIIIGFILNFSHRDWVSISLLIGMVLIAEAFNSVIEALSDTLSQEYRVNIRYAKDVSAGAVLISAMVSVVAGSLIVFPYLLEVVEKFLG